MTTTTSSHIRNAVRRAGPLWSAGYSPNPPHAVSRRSPLAPSAAHAFPRLQYLPRRGAHAEAKCSCIGSSAYIPSESRASRAASLVNGYKSEVDYGCSHGVQQCSQWRQYGHGVIRIKTITRWNTTLMVIEYGASAFLCRRCKLIVLGQARYLWAEVQRPQPQLQAPSSGASTHGRNDSAQAIFPPPGISP